MKFWLLLFVILFASCEKKFPPRENILEKDFRMYVSYNPSFQDHCDIEIIRKDSMIKLKMKAMLLNIVDME